MTDACADGLLLRTSVGQYANLYEIVIDFGRWFGRVFASSFFVVFVDNEIMF